MELWLRGAGTEHDYVLKQQIKAAAADAPVDALYLPKKKKGEEVPTHYRCLSDLKEDHPFHREFQIWKARGCP